MIAQTVMYNIFKVLNGMKFYKTPMSEDENPFSFLEKEKGHNVMFKPHNDLENPIALCERLGLKDETKEIMESVPFVGLSSQGRIWEYYVLGIFIDDLKINKTTYKRIKKPIGDIYFPYKGCNHSAIGNEKYEYWCDLYKDKIRPTNKQKKDMRSFADKLIIAETPLRAVVNQSLSRARVKAAKVFFEYLTQNFFEDKISVKSFIKKGFYDQLLYLFKQPKISEEYLLKVCLLLCLYGCNRQLDDDQFYIDPKFVSDVAEKLEKKSVEDEVFRDEVVERLSSGKGNRFYPPFSYVYQYYRERISIYMHLDVWAKLIKDTYNASQL